MLESGADVQSVATATDGPSLSSPKKTSWLTSLFGSATKPSSSTNSSQDSEEMYETDAPKKDEPAKKAEHITIPGKGKCPFVSVSFPVVVSSILV